MRISTPQRAGVPGEGDALTNEPLSQFDGITPTNTEFNYVDGVTSNIQTQLNNKLSASIIPLNSNFITEGDSRTASEGGGLAVGEDWPAQVIAMPAFAGRATLYNKAVGGSVIAGMAARYTDEVFPLRPAATGKAAILAVFCGGNDVPAETAADIIDALEDYCTTAQGHGFTVWAFIDIPRTQFDDAMRKKYSDFSRLMRLATWWDRLIDLGDYFQDPGDATAFHDGLHEGPEGALWIARIVNWHATQIAQPPIRQTSGITTDRLYAGSGTFGESVAIQSISGGQVLTLTGATTTGGNIFFNPASGSDYTGFLLSNNTVSADAGSRKFLMRANHSAANGEFNIIQTGDATFDTTFIRFGITAAGNIQVGRHQLWITDNTYDIGASGATRPRTGYFGTSVFSPRYDVATSVGWRSGSGSPESSVTANIGSLYSRTDGGTNTTLYRKESGSGNTGWVAVSNAGGSGSVPAGDIDLTALDAVATGDPITAADLGETPVGRVDVLVNGVRWSVGDGVKTKGVYFSTDAGTTARALGDIAQDDTCHLGDSGALTGVTSTDLICFLYNL